MFQFSMNDQKALDRLILRIINKGYLDGDIEQEIINIFGHRGAKALNVVKEKRIKKYKFTPSNREVWVVVGKEKEYLVIPRLFCSCTDFHINVTLRRKYSFCHHLLAQALAEAVGYEIVYGVEDIKYNAFIKEWCS